MGNPFRLNLEKKTCITPPVRGSYVSILEPKQLPNSDKEAYGMQMLLPKDDPNCAAFIKEVGKMYAQVLIDKFGEEKAKKIAAAVRTPFRDGDDPKQTINMKNPEALEGYWFANANNQWRQPYVIGGTGKQIPSDQLSDDYIYSGAWFRCLLSFYWYDKAGNKGIGIGLNGMMKVKDDTPLGGVVTAGAAEEAFSDFADEAADMAFGADDEADAAADSPGDDDMGGFNFM